MQTAVASNEPSESSIPEGHRSLPILFVDDEVENLRLFKLAFGEEFVIHTAPGGDEALRILETSDIAVLLSDERMPGMRGIELLAQTVVRWPDTVRVIVSAYGDAGRLLSAINRGHAHEYVLKPWNRDELRACLLRALAVAGRRRDLRHKAELADDLLVQEASPEPGLVGASGGLAAVTALIERAAGCDISVLITGETGTGKEQVARRIHDTSARARNRFVAVHCGALPENLLENELFGHESGAFSGASRTHRGRFELAHGGTLFLDEIGDISPRVQLALLRVLQERSIERLGGSRSIPVDVRVIAATHRNLRTMVQEGSFREDLHYRINVFPIEIPPLRERSRDIEALVQHFIDRYRHVCRSPTPPKLGADARRVLSSYRWPGNVRELENMIQRALVLCDGDELVPEDFTFYVPDEPPLDTVRDAAARIEATRLRELLLTHGGNFSKAARTSGTPRTTLISRAKKLGLL